MWTNLLYSIIDQITAAFPSDMPDLKEATNHLAPLTLPAQIGLYFPGREGRLGVQVVSTVEKQWQPGQLIVMLGLS